MTFDRENFGIKIGAKPTRSAPRQPCTFELPVRGSNDDHLDFFYRAGAIFGADIAAKVFDNTRLLIDLGLQAGTVGDVVARMRAANLLTEADKLLKEAGRAGVSLTSPFCARYSVRVAFSDIRRVAQELCGPVDRDDRTATFCKSANRVFKATLRPVLTGTRH